MQAELLTERVITPMTKTMLAHINEYRFSKRFEARSDAIRRLIEIGLDGETRAGLHVEDADALKAEILALDPPEEMADWVLGTLNPLINKILDALDTVSVPRG